MKYFCLGVAAGAEAEAASRIAACVEGGIGVPVRQVALPALDFAYDAGRGQFSSIAVLERLLAWFPGDGLKLLAVVEEDLFIPVLTFVFGHAQLGGRAGVVSLARLRQEFYGLEPDREAFLVRAGKEALHEAGHLFGLVHCPHRECVMSVAASIRQIDLKQATFCPACARLLRSGTEGARS
jgi:archaemetzincin